LFDGGSGMINKEEMEKMYKKKKILKEIVEKYSGAMR